MQPARDTFDRPLRSLRLSVTDRCNLRCGYCMPEEHYTWLPRSEILDYEEVVALVRALGPLGVSRVRLTGGEPLLRRDLASLVQRLRSLESVDDLALTTNAARLKQSAADLRQAGLDRLTISLDTLDEDRFFHLTKRREFGAVMDGIEAAASAGFEGTKLNAVIVRGENDDEFAAMLAFGAERGIEVRFIEYMDVGGATRWSMDAVVSASEMLQTIAREVGAPEPVEVARSSAPADRFRLPSGQVFGIIASTTRPFCGQCDRARLTADGRFFSCLYAIDGTPIGPVLRAEGAEAAAAAIGDVWRARDDRGAEKRLSGNGPRTALAQADELRHAPHLEMHTRGG